MTNRETTGLVQTVLGPVRPEALGPTLTHEHLLIDFLCMFDPPDDPDGRLKAFQPLTIENLGWIRYDPFRNRDNLLRLDEENAISEVALYQQAGGRTIIDVTTIGIGRSPAALVHIAQTTGLNIVMGAGYYTDAVHPAGMSERSEEDLADEMIADLTTGVGDTGVRAGIIGELGCSWPLTANERKVLRAGARAQQATGAAITIHPGRDETAPREILDVLASAGADLGRVIMGHLDRTIATPETLLDLAASGCYLEYDLFGWETSYYPLSALDMPNDAQRIAFVQQLIEAGYGSRLLLAHDIFGKHAMAKYGGYGYTHIIKNIVPRFREQGIAEETIHAMLVDSPARILAWV